MLSSRLPLGSLARLCRTLSTSLSAGVPIVKAFELAGKKAQGELGAILDEIVQQIKSGEDVTSALASHGEAFPSLMVDLLRVGEQSGALPEVLLALSEHYENLLRLQREFLGQIIGPIIRWLAAIHIVALVIYLLGVLGGPGQVDAAGRDPRDMLGWGLLGASGAMIWLTGWYVATAAALVAYKVITASLQGKLVLHRLLMSVPLIGHCMRDFAMARFSWSFALTQEAGLPIDVSLESALRSTANGVYIHAVPQIVRDVMSGQTLTETLEQSGLFTEEFVQIVEVGETSGTVPETLNRVSPQLEDQARRSLRVLAAALGWTVWILVALFIIFVIFSIVLQYIAMIEAVL